MEKLKLDLDKAIKAVASGHAHINDLITTDVTVPIDSDYCLLFPKCTVLFMACLLVLNIGDGYYNITEQILKHKDCDSDMLIAGKRGYYDVAMSALHVAAYTGNVTAATLLIRNGCDVNKKDSQGETSLHVAAACGQTTVIQVIQDSGCSMDVTTNRGLTAVHLAAGDGHVSTVELLIKHGCSVNVASHKDEYTPLHVAVQNGNLDLARILIRNGCDVNTYDKSGKNVLHQAVQRTSSTAVITFLLENGCSINSLSREPNYRDDDDWSHADDIGCNALHFAIQNPHQHDVVTLLIASGINVAQRSTKNISPLHMAVQCSNEGLVLEILAADPMISSINQTTLKQSIKIVYEILNMVDERNRQPLFCLLVELITVDSGGMIGMYMYDKNALIIFAFELLPTSVCEAILKENANLFRSRGQCGDETALHCAVRVNSLAKCK